MTTPVTDTVTTPVDPLAPGLELIKSADTSALSTPLAVGDIITYTFTVDNTGNTALAGVAPLDTLTLGTDGSGASASLTSGPTFSGGDTDGDSLLDVDEVFTYTATFALTQAAIDAGGVHNTAVSTGNPVDASGNDISGLGDVVDTSDNDAAGDGTDGGAGGTDDDPTVIALAPTPILDLDKPAPSHADNDGDGAVSVGDELTYTITATNTGNIAQTNVVVTDPLLDAPNTVTCPSCLLYTSPSPRDRG